MSDVNTKFKDEEDKYKIYLECTKMPIIENEPGLTDTMNELKSFKKRNKCKIRFGWK